MFVDIEILVPEMGESITQATVGNWLKKEGDMVQEEEPLVALETDKVTQEVPSSKKWYFEKNNQKTG